MERRQHHRIPLGFPIQLRIADLGKFSEQYAKDLSEGGIFIPLNQPLPEQSDVEMEFCLEEGGETVRARGTVVRSVPAEGDRPAGMAIAFTSLGKDGRQLVERLVRRYCHRHPSEASDFPPDLSPESARAGQGPARGVDLHVAIRMPGEEEFRSHQGHALRGREIFVLTETPLEIGTVLDLQLGTEPEAPHHPATAVIQAKVYSQGAEKTPAGPGMALSLRSPSEEVIALLAGPPPRAPEAVTVRLESGPLPYFGVDPSDLQHRNDEIFVRIPERPDTGFQGAPSYQVAVRDCLDLGGGDLLLKVRPDMHRRLFAELRAAHDAYRVYGLRSDGTARFVILDRIQATFGDTVQDRAEALGRYCLDVPPDGGPRETQYVLKPQSSLDPLAAARALQRSLPHAEISPIAIRFVDWIPRTRHLTDLLPLAEVGPALTAQASEEPEPVTIAQDT